MQYNSSMKIVDHPSIRAFFKCCRNNLYDTRLNAFLDRTVSFQNERSMQEQLQKAGAQEFDLPRRQWPSLFLSADDWEKNPYHRQIRLREIQSAAFTCRTEIIRGNRLFNAAAVQPDKNRELADWMKLRALDRDIEAVYLYQNEDSWMLSAPSEAATNDPIAQKAHGSVLTFGLGIGYFTFMALSNPRVDSVTIVERSPDVISLFRRAILPRFNYEKPLHIIRADAYDMWKPAFLDTYDTIYADIWRSGDDGLACMRRLLERYNPPFEKTDFWIEDSCTEPLRTQIFLHFEELADSRAIQPHPDYRIYMEKVRSYFQTLPVTVETVKQLKDLLYDRALARAILAHRVRF